MAIENITDLLASLGHKGAKHGNPARNMAPESSVGVPPVFVAPEPAEGIVFKTPTVKKPRSTQTAQTPSMKAAKTKKQSAWAKIEAKYPRYNPEVEGFGSADDWRGTFYQRMGWEKAMKILGAKSPRQILGVLDNATFDECRSAFKKLCKEWHPDRVVLEKKDPVEAAAKLEQIYAAFEVLEHENGK